MDDPSTLAIKGLGQFREFPVVSEFRGLLENWHISDLQISSARQSSDAGLSEHLSTRGDDVAQAAAYLYEQHPDQFQRILDVMRRRVPGVTRVEARATEDGRLVLRFQDGSFQDPFIARYVSDGTIKMFAYLILLHDPKPHPVLAVEEPENQLYPRFLSELVEEFRDHARRGGQRAYMDRSAAEAGHLIVFDRAPQRNWEQKIFRRETPPEAGAPVTVWGM